MRGPRSGVLQAALSLSTLGVAGALVLTQAMGEPLSHDENQFVASGWLLGEKGLLPYRDFPFHHFPNVTLLYALLGWASSSRLLTARLLSSAFGLGSVALVYFTARRAIGTQDSCSGRLIATGAAFFLVLSPLFDYTSGRAWNHALPVLLSLAAYRVQLAARRTTHLRGWFASGGLVGLAAGARASFLTALVPFAAFALLAAPRSGPAVGRRLRSLLAGFGLALTPTLALLALAPTRFIYGNLIYPLQNARYRQLLLHEDAMDLPAKLAYFADEVLSDPPHLLLASAGLWVGWRALRERNGRSQEAIQEAWLALGVALSLWLGALIPTPSWYQYFYAPLPFALVGMVALLRREQHANLRRWPHCLGIAVALVGLAGLRVEAFTELRRLAQPSDWLPMQVHRSGVSVAQQIGAGAVLSLAPMVPLEGGLEIYPALATGSLTWRISPFMDFPARQRYGVIAPQDLETYLRAKPPAGILVGFELKNEGFSLDDPAGGLELPLQEYALGHGYEVAAVTCEVCPGNILQVWTPSSGDS